MHDDPCVDEVRGTKRRPLQEKSGGARTVDVDDPRGPLPTPLCFLWLPLPPRERLNSPATRTSELEIVQPMRAAGALVATSAAQPVGHRLNDATALDRFEACALPHSLGARPFLCAASSRTR